ncbi:hypothetical protein GCM10010302_60060 [Streptomyces polychromogenes]|uniref:Uncharacterized protein n=1 Tax=Streptomyces polychromogenes TaxID=67342 RepID=A0ABP3FAM1_9ACTN
MTPATLLAADHSDLLRHLLVDMALKAAITVAALTVLALGMCALWRRAGRARHGGSGRPTPARRPSSRDL